MVAFSQRDERWAKDKLGTSVLTLGEAGCLVSAVAALLASQGVDTDPGRLNAWLTANRGYVSGNLFVYAAVEQFGCRFHELIRCYQTPAPVARLRDALGGGAAVLVCVDWTPGGRFQQHWVWLTALGERSGHVMDPWQMPGYELVGLDRYLAEGWSPERGIYAAAIYGFSGFSDAVLERYRYGGERRNPEFQDAVGQSWDGG